MPATSPPAGVTHRYDNFPCSPCAWTPPRCAAPTCAGVEVGVHPTLRESMCMVGAEAAWTDGYAGQGLAVAVIDDGADITHPFPARPRDLQGLLRRPLPERPAMLGTGADAFDGMSMAAPHVAGAMALLRQAVPQASRG